MRVTDEMVNKALDTLIEYGVLSMDTSIESDTAAARAALEAALSHAAGQDGEQCRAGAGEPVAWIRTDGVTTSDAGLMRHWEAQGLQFDPLIRALSRGVPEGEYPEAAEVCAEAYQVVGCMLMQLGLFDTPEAEKILDNLSQHRMVHRDVLPWTIGPAIAAQRKEG